MKRTLILLIVLLAGMSAFTPVMEAQMPIKLAVVPQVPPDSVDSVRASRKHFWRASAEVVGFNLGLWAFDRYVKHGDFAYISINSIKENFKHGFKWDNDCLVTNTFAHPYNGSLFYNAGRSNGFNFWQSELFAIGGSAMWEMFMECEYPSTNDIIATPIGGAAIGEVLYRASDAILDDRTTGAERFEREAVAFILDPMRGFNRIITGDAWKRRSTSGRVFGTPNVAIQASLGLKTLVCQGHFSNIVAGASAQIDVEYGDRFELHSVKPYDYFVLRAELNGMKSQPILSQMNIKGRLLAREFLEKKRTHASIGLYQHFDYYDSDTVNGIVRVPYKLGIPASLGAGLMFRDVARKGWVTDAYLHTNAVILGSVLSDHYKVDQRTYNWASGFSIKGGVNFVFRKNIFSLSLNHEFYRLFTWAGYRRGTDLDKVDYHSINVQGDHSQSSFHVSEIRADVRLYKRLFASLVFNNYLRYTRYRDFPDVKSNSYAFRLMLTYKL